MSKRSKALHVDKPEHSEPDCDPTAIQNADARKDILNRLKRAEGQLRGIQKMVEEGSPCMAVATQMAAVRKALDSTYVRITVCFMEQEMLRKLTDDSAVSVETAHMLTDIEALLGKIR